MRKGDDITVYYDGKRSRGTPGKVLKLRAQGALVRFERWVEPEGDDKIITLWFRRTDKWGIWLAWDKGVSKSILRDLFGGKGDPYLFYT